MWSPAQAATAADTVTELKCNSNMCATDISTALAASASCKGIHLNHPRDSSQVIQSAQPSDNQRTAAAIQRAADFLPSH